MMTILKTLATLLLLPVNLAVALIRAIYEVCEDFVHDVKSFWSESTNEKE